MSEFLLKYAPPLGAGYLKLVKATSRYKIDGKENLIAARSVKGAAVWVVWHNRQLGALVLHQDINLGSVISQSFDGELIARVVKRLGHSPLRGSSTRGGTGALKALLRHAKNGFDVSITPDGPKGPRYQVQKGAAFAAIRTGLPVLPLGVAATPKKVFTKSWDNFQLPLPFSTVQIVYGKPLHFKKDDPIDEVQEEIRIALCRATERADELLGVSSP
jgi:lysophospholipid acyltransferase (LPLAT)-like uncharacterized protein